MCLIVHRTLDDILTSNFIYDVEFNNQHGWGVLFHDDAGDVAAQHGWGAEALCEVVDLLQSENYNREFILHFRMSTHGDNEHYNQHPFKIRDNMWVMHNGIIDAPTCEDATKSDTWRFVEFVLKPILENHPDAEDLIRSPGFQMLLEEICGASNRLCFLDRKGPVFIGPWHETLFGVKVSNHYAYTVGNPTIKKYGAGFVPSTNTTETFIVPAKTPSTSAGRPYADHYMDSDWERPADDVCRIPYKQTNHKAINAAYAYEEERIADDEEDNEEDETMEDLIDQMRMTPEEIDTLVWSDPQLAAKLIYHLI